MLFTVAETFMPPEGPGVETYYAYVTSPSGQRIGSFPLRARSQGEANAIAWDIAHDAGYLFRGNVTEVRKSIAK